MKLVDLSVKRPVGLVMIIFAILALGFISLKDLAVDLYPEIDLPIAVVATSYPGAGPEEVEKRISEPMESAVSTIQGVDTIQSQSQPGSSLVILMLKSGTDMDNALLEIREKVDGVKGMLPEDANDPSVLRFDPQQIPVMWVGLSGDKLDVLQQIAENDISPYFERADGVASVITEGGRTREILIELNQAKLSNYHLSSMQVVQALSGANQSSSGGVITKGVQDLQIRVDGEFTSIEDIKNTIIPIPTGETVQVKDIAQIKDTFKEKNSVSQINGEDALVFSVLKESDANTIEVADAMHKAIKKVRKDLPEQVELSIVFDTSTFIRDSVSSVMNNMIVGGALAVGILMLFLRSIRATIVIGVSIPIAVISTFIMMYFADQTVNILSMGGLALGIGMMVDSSIVILENIFNYRQRGESLKDAARKGASELGSAVIASTTTSLVVFLPIVYVEGIASDLFTPLALAVSFSLIASLVVSLTLVPMISSKLLKKPVKSMEEGSGWFNRLFNKLNNLYKRTLNWVLGHRKTTVFGTIGVLVASFAVAPMIGTEFIPASDQGQLEIKIETAAGSSLEETEEIAHQVNEEIIKYKDVLQTNYLSIGTDTQTGTASSANKATFQILMIPPNEREMTTKELVANLSKDVEHIAGAEIKVAEMESGLGTGSPIQINIHGSEQDILKDLTEQVTWKIEGIEGIYNVQNTASEGRPEIQVEVDRDLAQQYGLSYQQIMSEVRLGFNGQLATLFREAGDEYDVRVIFPENNRQTIQDLEQMMLPTATGEYIPLSAVANLKQVIGPVQIDRQDQQRQISVTADVQNRDLGSVTRDIQAALNQMNFPEGYGIDMGGQSEDMAKSFQDLALALVFSIFLVYVVMAVQFESFVYPFVIMFSMPTMLIGVLVGLFLTGQPFSVPAFIGIIMLAGIVVNNAIVLVDYINILRDRGYDRLEAILEAGPSRLRPILMTTLTTVLGMIPLALGFGQGGEAQLPMAVVVIFGLSTSMLFTLLLIPVMYTILDDFTGWRKKFFKKITFFKRKKKVIENEMNL